MSIVTSDVTDETGEDIAKDKWVTGFTGLTARTGPRTAPTMGTGQNAYEQAAAQHLARLQGLAAPLAIHSKVKAAQQTLAGKLTETGNAATQNDFRKALKCLNEAVQQGGAVDKATAEAADEKKAFETRYNSIDKRRKAALDLAANNGLLPGVVPVVDARKALVAADGVLQGEITAGDYEKADPALDTLIDALDAFEAAVKDNVASKEASLKNAVAGLQKIASLAGKEIKGLAKGAEKTRLAGELDTFNKAVKVLQGEKDAYAALVQIATLEVQGKKILEEAFAASGISEKDRESAFKELLSTRFGITIKVPRGMTSANLERAYKMFEQVPSDHVNHNMLKRLLYIDNPDGGGAYGQRKARIEMGKYDPTDTEKYRIGGAKIAVNEFDVTTLHEIGHAVDAKYKIMQQNKADAGCGGWNEDHTIDDVAGILATDFMTGAGLTEPELTQEVVESLARAVLGGAGVARPNGMKPTRFNGDWAKLKPFLEKCAALREKADPWDKTVAVVGGRAYHQAYDAQWVSYDVAARGTTYVNKYQWRSSAEWFAEIYAITWITKKPPPAINAGAAAYMWGGAGATR